MGQFNRFTMDSITGEPVDFATFENKVVLAVNLASR